MMPGPDVETQNEWTERIVVPHERGRIASPLPPVSGQGRAPTPVSTPHVLPGAKPRTAYVLVVLNGAPFSTIELGPDPIDIGRAEGCAVRLDVPSLSRRHAILQWNGETHVLTDLNSSNGTRVNGVRVTAHALGHRDRIALGDALFTYRVLER